MTIKLGQIAEIRTGYPFRARLERDPAGAVAVIQMKDIDDTNRVDSSDLIRVQLPGSTERHLVQPGDLIFRSRGNSYTAAIIAQDLGRAVVAGPIILIRVTAPHVLPGYVQWFINQPAQAWLGNQRTGTALQMISKATLEDLAIVIPDIEKQQRILAIAELANREQQLSTELAYQRKRYLDEVLMRYAQDGGKDRPDRKPASFLKNTNEATR